MSRGARPAPLPLPMRSRASAAGFLPEAARKTGSVGMSPLATSTTNSESLSWPFDGLRSGIDANLVSRGLFSRIPKRGRPATGRQQCFQLPDQLLCREGIHTHGRAVASHKSDRDFDDCRLGFGDAGDVEDRQFLVHWKVLAEFGRLHPNPDLNAPILQIRDAVAKRWERSGRALTNGDDIGRYTVFDKLTRDRVGVEGRTADLDISS